MASDDKVDDGRRSLMKVVATAGGVAAVVTTAIPFVSNMNPSEREKAAGAPVEVDIRKLKPGEMMTVEWRGKPVWILHRSPTMIESLKQTADQLRDPHSERPNQPAYAKNEARAIKPEYLVVIGICTHLGCVPRAKFRPGLESGIAADWQGGFYCPCHSTTFDLAGRVYKDKPAPDNLMVPPHKFVGETKIVIGEDTITKGA